MFALSWSAWKLLHVHVYEIIQTDFVDPNDVSFLGAFTTRILINMSIYSIYRL